MIESLIKFQEQHKKFWTDSKEFYENQVTKYDKNDEPKHNHITVLPDSKIFSKVWDIGIESGSRAHKCHENSWREHSESGLKICVGVVYPISITESNLKIFIDYKPEMGSHLVDKLVNVNTEVKLNKSIWEFPIMNAGIHFWNLKDGSVYDTTLLARNYLYIGHEIDVSLFKGNEPYNDMFTFWKQKLIFDGVFPDFLQMSLN